MRVAFVVQSYPKDTETFVRAQRDYLGALVVVRRYVGEAPVPPYVEVLPTVSPLDAVGLLIRRLYRRARFGRPAGSYLSPRQESALQCILARRRPDVVIAQFGPSAIDVGPICRRLEIALVVHFHGADLSGYLRCRGYLAEMRRVLSGVQAVVTVSEAMRERFERVFPAFTGVHRRIPCGVIAEAPPPSGSMSVDPRRCRFVAVGRLVGKKGILITIRAFAHVAPQLPATELRIIGEGPLRPAAEHLIQRLDLTERVLLLGGLPHESVLEELRRAHVFVQHSLTSATGDQEGWPVAIAEAAAAGLPVVATRHAGIPEQVLDKVTGLLVDEGDVVAMAEAMLALGRDAELRERYGAAARKHMLQFTRSTQLARLEALLRRVVVARPTV